MADDKVTETTTETKTETTTQQPAAADQPGAEKVTGAQQVVGDGQVAGFTDLAAANAEISRLRRENAERRTSGRDLQQQIDELREQVPTDDVKAQIADLQGQLQRYQAAGEAGISPELLAASEELQRATTPEAMTAASEKIARLTAQQGNGSRNPAPPRAPSAPPSPDEQLSAAIRDRNMREVERLNAEKLAELGGT